MDNEIDLYDSLSFENEKLYECESIDNTKSGSWLLYGILGIGALALGSVLVNAFTTKPKR